jgi:hypothetical protein
MDRLEWTALEYEDKERDPDWFWALGIIVVTATLASIIYENYFFAVLIVLSGSLLGFFAKKKPDVVSYELNEKGLRVRSRLYPYENIKSFWIQIPHGDEVDAKDLLFIKTERFFMPIISIPIDVSLADDIKSIMYSKNIEEEEMREHASEKIMDRLGF